MYVVQHGASLVRVHDVKETADMLRVLGVMQQ
jgi:dihydropteroate synthase